MKKTILKVLAILGSVESVGFFTLGYKGIGYIFAVVAIFAILELTNIYIKENEDNSK